MERKESRGGFFGGAYRAEYPEQGDQNWLKHVVLTKDQEGGISSSFEVSVELEENLFDEVSQLIVTQWAPPDDPAYFTEFE